MLLTVTAAYDVWYKDAYIEHPFTFPEYQQGITDAPKMRWQDKADGRIWQEAAVNDTYTYPGTAFWKYGKLLGGSNEDSVSISNGYTTNVIGDDNGGSGK